MRQFLDSWDRSKVIEENYEAKKAKKLAGIAYLLKVEAMMK